MFSSPKSQAEGKLTGLHRIRGYQVKSKGGDPKMNRKGYNKLDDMAETLAEAAVPSPDVNAMELEEHGLGQTSRS